MVWATMKVVRNRWVRMRLVVCDASSGAQVPEYRLGFESDQRPGASGCPVMNAKMGRRDDVAFLRLGRPNHRWGETTLQLEDRHVGAGDVEVVRIRAPKSPRHSRRRIRSDRASRTPC